MLHDMGARYSSDHWQGKVGGSEGAKEEIGAEEG